MPPPRVADILLRAPAPRLVRLHWPAPGPIPPGPIPPGPTPPGTTRPGTALAGLVVLLTDGPADVAGALVDRIGAVVLAAKDAHLGSALAALAWAADHAAELGADPTRLALIGASPLVDRIVRRVDEEGWPPLRTVVALRPGDDPADALLAGGWGR